MGLQFFPRGGSAHVARNVAAALPGLGWDVTLVSGSVTQHGGSGDARRFYAGLDVRPVDMTAALAAPDPMLSDPPLHASYEDRPGAPDRFMASLGDAAYEHQVRAWTRALREAGAASADVLHLHHLSPLHEAAGRAAPDVPVVGHVHGTELLMAEAISAHPDSHRHGRAWLARMRRWAAGCERLIVLSEGQVQRMAEVLDVAPDRCVVVSNGFDPEAFAPRAVNREAFWRRHLVSEPRGWRPGAGPGSVGYDERALEAFAGDAPVLLYVGRFTAVKRVGVLIEAFARARTRLPRRIPLVLCGGFPGEWEGEHPIEAVERLGVPDVFLAGWHEHDELPGFLNGADLVVLPSVREQFGQVLVEAMACAVPVVAVDAHGPAEIVRDGETGWLVRPDDADDLARALAEALADPRELRRRGEVARADAIDRFAWPELARRVTAVYAAALSSARV